MIVPRPGEAAIADREAQRDGEVADEVPRREWHQQPADALAYEQVGACRGAASAIEQYPRLDLLARKRGGEVRRCRRPVAVGSDLLVALRRPGSPTQEGMVWLGQVARDR